MKCDKLFKEAFEGIEFRYKLDDTLEGLGSPKFTAKQLEGYLIGKGVSPKEIKQSGIFEGFENDNRALPADMWLENNFNEKQVISTFNVAPYDTSYNDITLGRQGVGNESYKETLSTLRKPKENAPITPHFSDEISTYKESLLGWRRTHIDEINGKKTLVLNEFQSDWAQTERAGRGTFESSYTGERLSTSEQEELSSLAKEVTEGLKEHNLVEPDELRDLPGWEDKVVRLHRLNTKKVNSPSNLVADFPMSELKHHQFQIVGAIDDAIKAGIDTIAIPIQRENELAGSKGVTKFYESLNTKILPDIRKKLEKQGLKIKVDKKPYTQNSTTNDLWTLTIEEVPNGKVKWDVYSLLGSLGLGAYASKGDTNDTRNTK